MSETEMVIQTPWREVARRYLPGYPADPAALEAAADEELARAGLRLLDPWREDGWQARAGMTAQSPTGTYAGRDDGAQFAVDVFLWPAQPVAILNTSIATEDGDYRLRTVSAAAARELIAGREILSAVGHEATAQALTEILGVAVPVNRIQFAQQPGQAAIVFKLRGRAPEGAILTLDEVEQIGFDLKVLERVCSRRARYAR